MAFSTYDYKTCYDFKFFKRCIQEICDKVNKTLEHSDFHLDMTAVSGCYYEMQLADVLGSTYKVEIRFHLWYAHYDYDDINHIHGDHAMEARMFKTIDRLNKNMSKWLKQLNEIFELWSDSIGHTFFGAFIDTGVMGIQDCNSIEVILHVK